LILATRYLSLKMNFLSHYYFERKNQDENMVIGTVLPDLVKNEHKDWNLYPQKNEALFIHDTSLNSLLKGWKKHLEVDKLFHSSSFFIDQMADLKKLLLPILNDSPVRPSFLAHIGVELVLDHLLVTHNKINIDSFYDHLNKVDDKVLTDFLKKCGGTETDQFFKFLNGFRSSRYLLSYQKLENISYALQRICMRLWAHPFNEETVSLLTSQLQIYKEALEKDYMLIFEEIEKRFEK
jgi:acyl carrier protein phosphodiesterase